MIDENLETMWKFVRGDLAPLGFEQWVCSNQALESKMGKKFYHELNSMNFSDPDQILKMKRTLMETLRVSYDMPCECLTLSDTDVIHMGTKKDEQVFAFLKSVKSYGEPLWWLDLDQCETCQQWWLIAVEQRHDDYYCLKRLTPDEAEKIIHENVWPASFATYEDILRVAWAHGQSIPVEES